jgi:hypothetical protein
MNPLGPPDAYVADIVMSTLAWSATTVSALVLLGVFAYVAMIVELLRGFGTGIAPEARVNNVLHPVARIARRKAHVPRGRMVVR